MSRFRRASMPLFLAGALCSRVVVAQPTAQEKAAAEALFQSGATLLDQQKIAEACEKFDASYTLDPALGTRLRLADCYDRVGRTASAWALFSEVAAAARAQGQEERADIAAVRVEDLEKRLSTLVLAVEPAVVQPGLTVTLNGTAIPEASWNVPLPVDPGSQSVQASAPSFAPWSGNIEVPLGPVQKRLQIPALSPPALERPSDTRVSTHDVITTERGGSHPLTWAGYVTGGVGILGLGVAAVLGYRAYSLNGDSLASCSSADANACTPRGKDLRDDAQSLAMASTIAAIAGSALVATGVTLLVVAPSKERPDRVVRQVHMHAFAGVDSAGVGLQGVLF